MKKIKIFSAMLMALITIFTNVAVVCAEPQTMPDGSIFDPEYYAANNPDVVAAYGSDNPEYMYQHYLNYGKKEGRLPYAGADKVTPVAPTATATPAPSVPRTTSNDASAYFARSVFVGDSVMAGYRNYLAKQKGSPVSSAGIGLAWKYSYKSPAGIFA